MNLSDEINALADKWSVTAIEDPKTIKETVAMARENERMLCAIQLKTLLTRFAMEDPQ